ncbi:MAG: hypothetical protein JWO82_3077 [Akkermansiaceae bacterium]|nr:hypothetical protein [Akkermansiaceae bacterium]
MNSVASPAVLEITPTHPPVLDPGFVPAVLWNREYRRLALAAPGMRRVDVALLRSDGTTFRWASPLLPQGEAYDALTFRYVERTLKFLLWQKGGSRFLIAGAPEVIAPLAALYAPGAAREFDWNFIGRKIFGEPLTFAAVETAELPEATDGAMDLGRHLSGCRIGFDLGGSDRKCAAVIDGEVVFSEEVVWDPYFQNDPAYHIEGVHDSLMRAAAHLPRVDAIGGSSAGVYVNNEVRGSSLFRGVSEADFDARIRRMFFELRERWNDIPFEVVNDGEVTALAGSMALGENSVLGIAMGTSHAAGYVDPSGSIRPWLNELAFAPVDYREDAPIDEWSRDLGCGVQFFSQQAVARLAIAAGYEFGAMPFPAQLVEVQKAMKAGDDRARKIYETIGTCFGYAIAHYADYYQIHSILFLGRVASGEGGDVIIRCAEEVLTAEFPELSIRLVVPDEKTKRHGQAVAAASLATV